MSNKATAAFIISVLIIVFFVILGVKSTSREDNWICQNGQWIKHGNPSAPEPKTGCGETKPEDITDNPSTNDDIENSVGDNLDANQNTDQGVNIVISEPKADQAIGLPLTIKGEARVFENTVNYRIKNSDGTVLMENFTTANSPDMGQFGPFEATVNYPEPKDEKGTVEVFEYSAKDGSELSKVEIPVTFKKVESLSVKVFFGNRKEDPDAQDCSQVYSVDRRIPKTVAVASETLKELLNGTTTEEQDDGFFSEINSDVKLQKISILGDVATVDFSQEMADSLDGSSCTSDTIKAQITETLKQFSTIKDVKITANGKDGVL